MADDRLVIMSTRGYQAQNKDKNGKGLHWTCDIHDELPVKMRPRGPGSELPKTMCQIFEEAVQREGDRPALHM